MKSLALRFSDNFAPKSGTIEEHKKIINSKGYVWYGKVGNKISTKILDGILANGPVRILLIKSSSSERYWATVEAYSYERQTIHPSYYDSNIDNMHVWLKITKIEIAEDGVLEKCTTSTGKKLSDIYKKSMGSYFCIDFE